MMNGQYNIELDIQTHAIKKNIGHYSRHEYEIELKF